VEDGLNESADAFFRDGGVRHANDEDIGLGSEVQRTQVVVEDVVRGVMNRPIDLDREAELGAIEVDDVPANDLLAAEL
jgi:hypothetical protein